MAVGDDWQSIYAFSGSILPLFTKFCEKVGYGQELKITRTYRNAQEIIDIAGTFVQKNSRQIKKEFADSPLAGEYYYTKASFIPIPEQLARIGEEYRIGFYDGNKLEKILRQLYLLHPKKLTQI